MTAGMPRPALVPVVLCSAWLVLWQTHALGLWKELEALGPAAPHAYVCGVKKMLLEVRDVLKTQGGADRKQLHLESYD